MWYTIFQLLSTLGNWIIHQILMCKDINFIHFITDTNIC